MPSYISFTIRLTIFKSVYISTKLCSDKLAFEHKSISIDQKVIINKKKNNKISVEVRMKKKETTQLENTRSHSLRHLSIVKLYI